MVFDGVHGIDGGDESLPYPDRVCSVPFDRFRSLDRILSGKFTEVVGSAVVLMQFEVVLNELTAQVEILVLNANGRDGLSTCVLRPSNPFGPGDSSFLQLLVAAARSGLAKVWQF